MDGLTDRQTDKPVYWGSMLQKQAWIADPRKDPRPHYRNLCVLKESGIGHLHLLWQVVFMKTTSKKWRWRHKKTSKNETNLKQLRLPQTRQPVTHLFIEFAGELKMKMTSIIATPSSGSAERSCQLNMQLKLSPAGAWFELGKIIFLTGRLYFHCTNRYYLHLR